MINLLISRSRTIRALYNTYKKIRDGITQALYKTSLRTRGGIIQVLLNTSRHRKYLEIGVSTGTTFISLKAKYKEGVDPVEPSKQVIQAINGRCVYNAITSDEFFSKLGREGTDTKFDVIFIDGLHEYHQAYRDITNSLNFLEKDGVIVVHDCKPISEVSALPPKNYFQLVMSNNL